MWANIFSNANKIPNQVFKRRVLTVWQKKITRNDNWKLEIETRWKQSYNKTLCSIERVVLKDTRDLNDESDLQFAKKP